MPQLSYKDVFTRVLTGKTGSFANQWHHSDIHDIVRRIAIEKPALVD
jgi:hypothetical protein